MKIIRMKAENLKRLEVVEITPKGDVVEIAGDNGEGKTSVLDSIEWALRGADTIQPVPLRKGTAAGYVTLELGDGETVDLMVTRKFQRGEDGSTKPSTLRVERANGDRPGKPQNLLDTLYAALAIDPVDFIRSPPAKRHALLKGLVPGFDFEAQGERRKRLVDDRQEAGRDAARLKAQLAAFDDFEGVPDVPVDTADLFAEIEGAQEAARLVSGFEADMLASRNDAARRRALATEISGRVERMRDEADELEANAAALLEGAALTEATLAERAPPPAAPDTKALLAKVAEATRTNEDVAAKQAKGNVARLLKNAEDKHVTADKAIAASLAAERDAIAVAELPVEGLSLGDDDVLLDGLPFEQASDAKQLRVSMAIAMALNPKLRVIRVRDGSLLDKKAMALLAEVAKEDGWQIWIERVDPSGPEAIIMQEGKVKK